MSQTVRHQSSRVIHIHNRAFEEDLTRDTLNRLIQRIDEEFYMPDEFEPENP
jgi:elongation factor P hydroxylase